MLLKHLMLKRSLLFSGCIFFMSCSTSKYATMAEYNKTDDVYENMARGFASTIKAYPPEGQMVDSLNNQQYFVGTVNMGMRKPNYVIIHHTAQNSTEQTLKTFTLTRTAVSAHYVVGRDGKVIQMVNDFLRAQHAGLGKWGTITDMNSCSIGIELDNNGTTDEWTEAQINSLCSLLATLKKKYNIPSANFIGHADYAPTRKPDPHNFPWKTLATKGFGLWYDDVLQTPPLDFDTTSALRIIGYDVKNVGAAITAFKRHWVATDITPTLTESDKLILYNLYKKFM